MRKYVVEIYTKNLDGRFPDENDLVDILSQYTIWGEHIGLGGTERMIHTLCKTIGLLDDGPHYFAIYSIRPQGTTAPVATMWTEVTT